MRQPDPTTDSSAMLRDLFDALVRCSLERIEAERNKGDKVVDGPGLFKRNEACDYLSIGLTKFNSLRRKGHVRGVDVDGTLRFTRTDLDVTVHFPERLPNWTFLAC